jgi:hypothetical protein
VTVAQRERRDVDLDHVVAGEVGGERREARGQVDVAEARLGPDPARLRRRLVVEVVGRRRGDAGGEGVLEVHPDDAVGVVPQHRGHVHARPRHVPGVRPEGEQVRADAVQHRAQLVLGLHPAADVRVQGGGDPLVAHRRAAQGDALDDDLEPVRVEAVAHRGVGPSRRAGRLDRRDHAEPLAERRLPGREDPGGLRLLLVCVAVGERTAVETQCRLQPERREPVQVVDSRHVVGHVRLDRRVADLGQLGERRAQRAGGPVRDAPGEPVGDGVDGQARTAELGHRVLPTA